MMTEEHTGPYVEASGLTVDIGGRTVLHDVSFDIERGGSLALVGESGSGKTVSSRVFTGLLTRIGGTVTGGRAMFDGQDLRTLSTDGWDALHGKRIALVPQASLSGLDPVLRIGTQLAETIRVLDPSASDVTARSIELLDSVKLRKPRELLRYYPHELSGGMRQRVMIALALAGRPEMIVADEPTTALDVTVQKGVLETLAEIRRETGMTLMIISHDISVVQAVAERVAVMQQGRIVELGAMEQVLTRPAAEYTRALLAARPDRAVPGAPLAVLDRATGRLAAPPEIPPAAPGDGSEMMNLSGVSVTYRNAKSPALSPVDLRIVEGETIGIIGESGSGKTTLGRVMVGALAPSEGSIAVAGRPWAHVRRGDPLRREVQMIFQDPYGSLPSWRTPHDTVAEVIQRWTSATRVEAGAKADALLDEVGLSRQSFHRKSKHLSGGECQRAGIARALAASPRLIVADEPTSSLDVSVQAQILNLMMRLRAERGLTLVLISHDLGVVRHMTDRALVLRGGAVVESGPTQRLLQSPQEEYTKELVASSFTDFSGEGKREQ